MCIWILVPGNLDLRPFLFIWTTVPRSFTLTFVLCLSKPLFLVYLDRRPLLIWTFVFCLSGLSFLVYLYLISCLSAPSSLVYLNICPFFISAVILCFLWNIVSRLYGRSSIVVPTLFRLLPFVYLDLRYLFIWTFVPCSSGPTSLVHMDLCPSIIWTFAYLGLRLFSIWTIIPHLFGVRALFTSTFVPMCNFLNWISNMLKTTYC